MEVLTTRREHFRNKLDDIDKEMKDFINNKTTSELIAEKIKEKWVKDSVTNNTRIEKVLQNNINGKKEAFQKDKMKMRNLTEDSTTPENIAQTERNANIRKNEDRFYTRNGKPSQNPIYNRSNYSTRYNRCKNNETNSRHRNDTYLENNKKLLSPTQKVLKITISPKIINLSKYKLMKPELSLLGKGPKFTPTTKGNVLN